MLLFLIGLTSCASDHPKRGMPPDRAVIKVSMQAGGKFFPASFRSKPM